MPSWTTPTTPPLAAHVWRMDAQGYAVRGARGKAVRMHRVIVDAQPGEEVDHIDHNPANNQRANLRRCSHRENMLNRSKPKISWKGRAARIYAA